MKGSAIFSIKININQMLIFNFEVVFPHFHIADKETILKLKMNFYFLFASATNTRLKSGTTINSTIRSLALLRVGLAKDGQLVHEAPEGPELWAAWTT